MSPTFWWRQRVASADELPTQVTWPGYKTDRKQLVYHHHLSWMFPKSFTRNSDVAVGPDLPCYVDLIHQGSHDGERTGGVYFLPWIEDVLEN